MLILQALCWKGSAEAASLLPQASALLPCAGCVASWRGGRWGSGKLLQPPEDLGTHALGHDQSATAAASLLFGSAYHGRLSSGW